MTGSQEERETGRLWHKVGSQPCEGGCRDSSAEPASYGMPKTESEARIQKARKDAPTPRGWPAPRFWTCGLQNCKKVNFSCFKQLCPWSFINTAWLWNLQSCSWRKKQKPSRTHGRCKHRVARDLGAILTTSSCRPREVKPFVWESSPSCWKNLLFLFICSHPTYTHTH